MVKNQYFAENHCSKFQVIFTQFKLVHNAHRSLCFCTIACTLVHKDFRPALKYILLFSCHKVQYQ